MQLIITIATFDPVVTSSSSYSIVASLAKNFVAIFTAIDRISVIRAKNHFVNVLTRRALSPN